MRIKDIVVGRDYALHRYNDVYDRITVTDVRDTGYGPRQAFYMTKKGYEFSTSARRIHGEWNEKYQANLEAREAEPRMYAAALPMLRQMGWTDEPFPSYFRGRLTGLAVDDMHLLAPYLDSPRTFNVELTADEAQRLAQSGVRRVQP